MSSLLQMTTLKLRLLICILDLLFYLLFFYLEVGLTGSCRIPNFLEPEKLLLVNSRLLCGASLDPLYEGI